MRLAKVKSSILEVSHQVYKNTLVFYPKDLRCDFGNDMVEVFDQQALEAYCRSGFWGLLRVWFGAAQEIVTVGVCRLAEQAVPIVAITATLTFMLWFASYIGNVMQTACSSCIVN